MQHGESPVVNIDSQRYDRDGFRVSDNSAALTILLNGYAACIILTGVITSSLLSPPSERSEWQRCCFRSMCVCVCVCAQRTGQLGICKNSLGRDMHSDERLLVPP